MMPVGGSNACATRLRRAAARRTSAGGDSLDHGHDGDADALRQAPAAEAEILADRQHSGDGPVTLGAPLDHGGEGGAELGALGGSGPRLPVARNKRAQPGEPLHLDTTTSVRFWNIGERITRDEVRRSLRAGWQHVRVAVADRSRLADTEARPTARRADAFAFMDRVLAWFRAAGITVQAVMTEDRAAYRTDVRRQS